MPIMTRDKKGTRDKTGIVGTSRDKTGTTGTKQGQQGIQG